MLKRMFVTTAIVAALLGAMTPSAEAALINGGISFAGSVEPSGGSGTSWIGATGIDWTTPFNILTTVGVSGDFAAEGVPTPYPVVFKDFSFNPFAPVASLWTFAWNGKAYTFDLNTVTILYQGPAGPNQSILSLYGTGVMKITGYDDTPAAWNFTGQESGGNFSFAMGNSAPIDGGQCERGCDPPTVTPEPGSLILLGTGLVGAARAFRKKQAQKS